MTAAPATKLKKVYLNEEAIGSARTWHEVAAILTKILRRTITVRDAQRHSSEGREAFYARML